MLTGLEGTRAVAHGARRRADVHEFRSRRGASSRLGRRVATPHGRLDRESAAAVECVARGGQPFPDCRFGRPSCSVSDETTGSGEAEEGGSRGRGHRVRRSGVSASTRLPVRVARSLPKRCHPRGTRVRKCLGWENGCGVLRVDVFGQLAGFRSNPDRDAVSRSNPDRDSVNFFNF